jgi:hypothetical protein
VDTRHGQQLSISHHWEAPPARTSTKHCSLSPILSPIGYVKLLASETHLQSKTRRIKISLHHQVDVLNYICFQSESQIWQRQITTHSSLERLHQPQAYSLANGWPRLWTFLCIIHFYVFWLQGGPHDYGGDQTISSSFKIGRGLLSQAIHWRMVMGLYTAERSWVLDANYYVKTFVKSDKNN